MCLLTFDECWNLLYQKVFENKCLSPKFEKIGKEIARICQGLPLATVVMAGILLKIGNSLDEWKKVIEDVNVLMSKDLDHHCSKVLELSYYHLPCHLRACLPYLVVFKKSNEMLEFVLELISMYCSCNRIVIVIILYYKYKSCG
ncbi:hypothetical protein R3W88_012105 [Solanum pinnatisectum]|uniref:NB-ARC domain-containing protein n=1 Tax=Solanum pinnatisectum TaxID=50273 RepID=A0AAV9LBX1_9SOLN|nr:hypothetical protein R3W88_012105 [Solanum pinnatisectum]